MFESNILEVVPIPAFQDNYIWLLRRGSNAALVDPGDSTPALAYLQKHGLALDTILVTHHHADHVGGVEELLQAFPAAVYAPRQERYSFPHHSVGEGDVLNLPSLDLTLSVLETPGHTLGHVAYYGAKYLFCGDTLFGCGCGRLFEGTCAQLHASLQKLAQLPGATQVFCAHEYTLQNIRFARLLDPDNDELAKRETDAQALRAQGLPTMPSTIALELDTNPFLRCDCASIRRGAIRLGSQTQSNPESVFCAIREIKNHY